MPLLYEILLPMTITVPYLMDHTLKGIQQLMVSIAGVCLMIYCIFMLRMAGATRSDACYIGGCATFRN